MALVDETEAVRLLGLSDADPERTLSIMWDRRKILRFEVEGRTAYPLFQFDADSHCIRPGISAILARRPSGWTDYRLLNWLVTPHLDFGRTPAEAVSRDGDAVVAAFARACEAPRHG